MVRSNLGLLGAGGPLLGAGWFLGAWGPAHGPCWDGWLPIACGSLGLWRFHLGPPSSFSWGGHVVVIGICGLRSSVILRAANGPCLLSYSSLLSTFHDKCTHLNKQQNCMFCCYLFQMLLVFMGFFMHFLTDVTVGGLLSFTFLFAPLSIPSFSLLICSSPAITSSTAKIHIFLAIFQSENFSFTYG